VSTALAKRNTILTLLIVALVACAYVPVTFRQAGFVWDDDVHVTNNAAVQSPGGLGRIWLWPVAPQAVQDFDGTVTQKIVPATPQYYPLTFSTFWAEYQLFGANARVYHINNVLLHLLSALVLWRLLLAIKLNPVAAFLAAAIFAVHPVHVESVAWVSERKNTLSLLLFLLSAWAFVRWVDGEGERRAKWYGLSVGLFALALAAKTVTVVLPVILLLWLVLGGQWTMKRAAALVPMVVLAVGAGLWTSHVEHTYIITPAVLATPDFDLSFTQRLMIAGRAVVFYVGKLFAPVELTFMYERWAMSPLPNWWGYVAGVAVATPGVTIAAMFKKSWRGVALGVLFFLVAIGPALGFVSYYPMIYSFVADHFQYIASIGIIALTAGLGVRLFEKAPLVIRNVVGFGLAGVVLVTLTVATYLQASSYRDVETLWRTTIERNPTAWAAWQNLGDVLLARGDAGEALKKYQKAYALRPEHPPLLNALGIAHRDLGNLVDAETFLGEGLNLAPEDFLLNQTMGSLLVSQGKHRQGEVLLRRALAANPKSMVAMDELGNSLRNQASVTGNEAKFAEAIKVFEQALATDPKNASVYNNLGLTYLAKGNLEEAERRFVQALNHAKFMAQAHQNLGEVQKRQGKLKEALQSFANAIQSDKKFAMAYCSAGEVLAMMGKERDAESYLRASLAMNKTLAAANGALAEILSTSQNPQIRNVPEAVERAEAAVKATDEKEVVYLELLAQVYSVAGNYRAAVRWQNKAIAVAIENKMIDDQVEPMRQRLTFYQKLAVSSPG